MNRNLKAEMTRNELVIDDIAKAINKSQRATAAKIRGEFPFTFAEARTIRDKLFPGLSMEYLFDEDSDNEKNGIN